MIEQRKEQYSRVTIDFTSVTMGNDLCVVITGGEVPHLGAVAVAQARPSLKDSSKRSSSTSIITLLGHKEDMVARSVASHLAAKLNKNVVVCCGIHVNDIKQDELDFIDLAMKRFCDQYP